MSAAAEKKQRVAGGDIANQATTSNSLQLVRGRTFPLAIEFHLSQWLDLDDLGQAAWCSKQMQIEIHEYLRTAQKLVLLERGGSIEFSPAACRTAEFSHAWSLLRHCASLRSLVLPDLGFGEDRAIKGRVRDIVVALIRKNKATLEEFVIDAPQSHLACLEVVAVLGMYPKLQNFEEWAHMHDSMAVYSLLVKDIARRCRAVSQLQLGFTPSCKLAPAELA
jgi:hypothetical protein